MKVPDAIKNNPELDKLAIKERDRQSGIVRKDEAAPVPITVARGAVAATERLQKDALERQRAARAGGNRS